MEDEWELTSHFRQKGKNVQNHESPKEMMSLEKWREEAVSGAEGLEFEEGLEVTLRSEFRRSVMSSPGITSEVPSHTHHGATGGFKLRKARSSFSLREDRVKGAWPGITSSKGETTTKPRVRSIRGRKWPWEEAQRNESQRCL